MSNVFDFAMGMIAGFSIMHNPVVTILIIMAYAVCYGISAYFKHAERKQR